MQVFEVPRRDQARFRQRAMLALVLTVTLGVLTAAYAAASGQDEFVPYIIVVTVILLLGGFIGLWRLVAAWDAGPSRAHAVVACFSLGLLSWAITEIVYLVQLTRDAALLEFPSIVDVPNFFSAAFWTIGVWLLYEGGVDDFLEEVQKNSYFLTLLAVLCFFVLTIAEGNEFGRLLWSGNDLAKRVTQALLPLAWAVNGFLLFRASRGQLGKRLRIARAALRALALGLTLAAVSSLLFAVEAAMLVREPGNVLAYRNAGLSDLLAMMAYLFLAIGVLHFPLDAPLFDREDENRPNPRTETAS
jgi:hypothetical protein